ncbi:peptide-methionine (S)-S-oxide reductase [Endozoicomonas sp. OPT23]|uniref:peptide-methionine (S)-S-oxide reductase MsrA n=1 Tax=Endozoicomonas sp. OPT23 TaxID=2072845 RepID=UPI00129BFE3D|nr:peptide-methionine (S)-S-oxide reductase MsrA [Endozoicomonas sp. OPT23]MRI34712.1 peptide-methionine (S)-S-oxide reductase [Endozoicomonas sp. OPT23]
MSGIDKDQLPTGEQAIKGKPEGVAIPESHFVNGHSLTEIPEQFSVIYLGMGCFWGAERLFWQKDGIWTTAVGYMGGSTVNATYEEVCSGATGHAEVVMVAYDPSVISLDALLKLFWESHDPTQGMRQGNDRGTQYRSAIYMTEEEQAEKVQSSKGDYQQALIKEGRGNITTEVQTASDFYYAEAYHQQYLAKNPEGYCGLGGTGVCLPPSLNQ